LVTGNGWPTSSPLRREPFLSLPVGKGEGKRLTLRALA